MEGNKFLPPPYTWFQTIDITTQNYNVPDNIICVELRNVTEGKITIDTPERQQGSIQAMAYDVFRLRVTRVYRNNTDVGLRNNDITLFGYTKLEIDNY